MSESESEVLSTLLTRLYMRPHTASNQVLSFSLLFLKVNGSSGCNLVLRLNGLKLPEMAQNLSPARFGHHRPAQ